MQIEICKYTGQVCKVIYIQGQGLPQGDSDISLSHLQYFNDDQLELGDNNIIRVSFSVLQTCQAANIYREGDCIDVTL